MPDFSITTCACPPAASARAALGCGEGVGVGTAIARGGSAGVSEAALASSTCGAGVFRGLGVSTFDADFDLELFFVLSTVFFAPDLFFALFGFGVGVWRRFVFGVGDLFGCGVDAARVSVSPA
jgi:hypothetical protein